MISKDNITGIILSGGQSTRMGTDKALTKMSGKPMISYVLEATEPMVGEIFIVSDHPEHDVFGLPRVTDIIPSAGPLAGLCAGLSHSHTEFNLVLSCDIPQITPQTIARLINGYQPGLDMVQLATETHVMPLVALYRRSCLKPALELLGSGEHRVRMLAENVRSKVVRLEPGLASTLLNINSPVELKNITNED